jgi:hypothetical protein
VRHTLRFHPAFDDDAEAAFQYYNEIDSRLRARLQERITRSYRVIRRFPHASSVLFDDYRHVVLPPFP